MSDGKVVSTFPDIALASSGRTGFFPPPAKSRTRKWRGGGTRHRERHS
jgi:hypothetical protein